MLMIGKGKKIFIRRYVKLYLCNSFGNYEYLAETLRQKTTVYT